MTTSGTRLLTLWRRCRRLPAGMDLFSRLLARRVPYSGSIKPRVLALEPGHARVALKDSRRVRNHLGSVHAIALANLAELASGLAMMTALPAGVRGIVVRLTIDYVKKARGPLIATGYAVIPPIGEAAIEQEFVSEITDMDDDVVAHATVRWRLAPAPYGRAE